MASEIRKDLIVFILIIVLAALIGRNLIYQQNLKQIYVINQQIKEEEQKNEILEIISILDAKVQRHQSRSFATKEIAPVLDRVSQLAEAAKIGIETFNPLPIITEKQYVELPLKIPLSCHYHRLGEFLSLLESNQELIWVKRLKMRKIKANKPEEITLPQIELTVSGIYLKQ